MPSNPIAAGRKGGSRNTPAQQAARKRNGFQSRAHKTDAPAQPQPTPKLAPQPFLLGVLPPKE